MTDLTDVQYERPISKFPVERTYLSIITIKTATDKVSLSAEEMKEMSLHFPIFLEDRVVSYCLGILHHYFPQQLFRPSGIGPVEEQEEGDFLELNM